tara:strand:+ start:414 stop:2543 length:2130 start_codon:yes stop_codon:yes gene_type:complete
MDAEDLVNKAREQRARKRFEEAVISAKAATVQDPDNADGWWQLALNSYSLGRKDAALAAVSETTVHAPHCAAGWSRRGSWELEAGEEGLAEDSFYTALELDEDNIEALEGIAQIRGKGNSDNSLTRSEEIQILTKLDQITTLSSWSVNRLGVLHYQNKHGFEAIKYWSRNAYASRDTAEIYNLGLAFNMSDVSQDVDAIDCWRMVIHMDESNENAPKRVQAVKPRLLDLARTVRASRDSLYLPEEQWFSTYLNPYQLLNCPADTEFEDVDPKIVQGWKKSLLQEIELEEGKLAWMPSLIADRSKAIELSNELADDEIAFFHWQVFKCKPLLEFLSKGSIEHFLLDENWSPLDLIKFVGNSDGFREWLSEPFSIQYDRVFTKAISNRNVPAIEAFLDGRRWVLPAYADRCFENALRESESMLVPLRELKERAEREKISAEEMGRILDKNKIVYILNLLPPYFRDLQNEAVQLVRSIAIDAHNIHDDSDLSLAILDISKRFSFKSIDLSERLKDDYETITEMISEQRKHESVLHFGKERVWKVTKEGVLDNADLCPTSEIISLRWGIRVLENGAHNYLFAAKRKSGKDYVLTWTATSDKNKQEELFDGVIKAAFYYIIPSLIERLRTDLDRGDTLFLGPVEVTKYGLTFDSKGFFFTKRIQVSWDRADIRLSNGSAIIFEEFSGKKSMPISLRDVANASILILLKMSFSQN